MLYTSTDAPVRRSIDTEGTNTANAGRYRETNDRVRLAACNGLPIAFRLVRVMNTGSFATSKVQAVTAKGCTPLSTAEAERLHDEATLPLN